MLNKPIPLKVFNNIKVWYIDDDKDDQYLFAEAFKRLGLEYTLTTSYSCIKLFKQLDEGKNADIIFLDVHMPLHNGIECLQMLKQNKFYKNIPVIVCSGSISPANIDKIYELGAHNYLIKPISFDDFIESLKIIFSVNWKQQQLKPDRENFVIDYLSLEA